MKDLVFGQCSLQLRFEGTVGGLEPLVLLLQRRVDRLHPIWGRKNPRIEGAFVRGTSLRLWTENSEKEGICALV